jgi:nucleoprotein TPR
LESAQREVENLKESRERQREMVQAIVNQRDMYRTLLAQATPLPGDTSLSPVRSGRRGAGGEGKDISYSPGCAEKAEELVEVKKELEESQEQFAAYKKEKMTNDSMLQEQLDKLREECSELKIINAKLGSKVCVVFSSVRT